jgi:hypothetical protein
LEGRKKCTKNSEEVFFNLHIFLDDVIKGTKYQAVALKVSEHQPQEG